MSSLAPEGNVFGAKTTLVSHDANTEWETWDVWLLPELREILRELPVEFSAVEALRGWREIKQYHMFASKEYLLSEFRTFMMVNVQHVQAEMRKEDALELRRDAPVSVSNIVDKYFPNPESSQNDSRNLQN